MDAKCGAPLDSADLGLIEALAGRARTEVSELADHLRMPQRRVRERIRLLERSGLVRGYHATATAADPTARVLILLRFTSIPRPSADDLSALPGVRRVLALCTGWDFMLEVLDDARPLLAEAPSRGEIRLLGARAEFELMRVLHDRSCPGGATPELRYEMPPA